jgi:predicted small integral membrane protein
MSRRKRMFAVVFLCIATVLLGMAAQARAQTVVRGTEDLSLTAKGAHDTTAKVDLLATKLQARLLRFDLWWTKLEPRRGEYDQTYLNQLAKTFHAAASDGLQVIVTMYGTPRWASDRTLWRYAPPGVSRGVYHSFYPPAVKRLGDFQAFATKLASTFGGDVTGYECRNEPNLWTSVYPQRTPSDAAFAVRRYAAMLTAFSKGVRAGNPSALVIAGATGPIGRNTDLQTSPQRFARLLKGMVALSVFDAYSHHPYAIGGTRNIAPEATPRDPAHTVSLGNISTLLRIFPSKPFYLSEYGYYTKFSAPFGFCVSQATQAAYLTRAYKYAARFPQVKALIWFPYHDSGTDHPSRGIYGTYSGLVTGKGAFKPSWYAFSGGNRLTLEAATLSGSARLSGQLTSKTMGGLRGKALVLYRRTAGHAWHVARNLTTGAGGSYKVTVTRSGAAFFKVAWLGVVRSPTLSVK